MHILDWLEEEAFAESLSEMIAVTGMTATPDGNRMPRNSRDRAEARLGKQCGGLVSDDLNLQLRDWWLVKHAGANVPNWDLACATTTDDGRSGLVLVEAKAHVAEFLTEIKGKGIGNVDNHARIASAIEEARCALSRQVPDVGIAIDRWYQLANRIAFAWKLAASGVPTTLVYLGFVGDAGVGLPIRNHEHWAEIIATASDAVPEAGWETRIDCGPAPLWVLARTRHCIRQTPSLPKPTSASRRESRTEGGLAPSRIIGTERLTTTRCRAPGKASESTASASPEAIGRAGDSVR